MEPTGEASSSLSPREQRLKDRIWRTGKKEHLPLSQIDDLYLDNIEKWCKARANECTGQIQYLIDLEEHKEPGGGQDIIDEENERKFWHRWVAAVREEKQRRLNVSQGSGQSTHIP